jgi:hypothetical protein
MPDNNALSRLHYLQTLSEIAVEYNFTTIISISIISISIHTIARFSKDLSRDIDVAIRPLGL